MGRPNGQGQVISLLTNEVQYEGEVIDSIYNGKGCRYCKGVLYEEGIFDKGLIVEGVRYNFNGTVYSGYFENNVYHGNGRLLILMCQFGDEPAKEVTACRQYKDRCRYRNAL